uniref:Retrovirus-related Pol polyprotein from transposon 17.6 n=1 Tax=Schistocephalus solidus TaxID=70667 RepID=A0A0X3PDV6_SCHSO
MQFEGFFPRHYSFRGQSLSLSKNVKVLKNVRELQSFMGLDSYYSSFIAGLHNLNSPLNRLLCKDAKFDWSTDCHEAFDSIKTKITESNVLSNFEADKKLSSRRMHLRTD